MNRPQVQSKVRSIMSEELAVTPDRLTEEVFIKDGLGADSMDLITVEVELEKEFEMTFEDDCWDRIATFGDLVDHVCKVKGIALSTEAAEPALFLGQVGSASATLAGHDCKSCGAHSAASQICSFCGRAL